MRKIAHKIKTEKHTDMLPPMSDLTRDIAAPNLSAIRKTLAFIQGSAPN